MRLVANNLGIMVAILNFMGITAKQTFRYISMILMNRHKKSCMISITEYAYGNTDITQPLNKIGRYGQCFSYSYNKDAIGGGAPMSETGGDER